MKPFLLLASVLLASCAKEQRGDCFIGSGGPASELRSLPAFRSIVLDDRIDLELRQDSTAEHTVLVEAGSNLLGRITTEVRDGELHIGSDLKCNWVRKLDRPMVRLTFRHLDRITYRGVGDITATTPIRGRTFRLEQWDGHGTVRLQLHVDTAWIGLHTGVGDAVIGGSAGQLSLYTLNFGHIDAGSLDAREVLVNNSGSGDIRCRASDALFVQVRDVGDVYYGGDPPTMDALVVGSGRLIRVD
jgi:hypothetical protein